MALMKAKTIYGTVTGVPGNEPQTTVFKGVPFAKPPVGPLRFHEPVEPDPWDGELVCDKWPNAPVMEPNPHYQGLPESEDCLYMNIFTPAESPNAKLPVMFWIYGGGFNYGCIYTDVSESLHKGESARYRGEALNKRGVILVTINYRVSVMGFMSHPKLIERDGHAGNYGLLDLVAGLNWVHDNIAAFGGDPDNVTIFGQSAGAVSCRMLMTSPLTKGKGLFRRAIIQSGCSLNHTALPIGLENGQKKHWTHSDSLMKISLQKMLVNWLEQCLSALTSFLLEWKIPNSRKSRPCSPRVSIITHLPLYQVFPYTVVNMTRILTSSAALWLMISFSQLNIVLNQFGITLQS